MKRALVLSGGGSRGAYEIGAWQALSELGIRLNSVYGTSIGAINAALVVQGDLDMACSLWENIRMSEVLNTDDEEFNVESMIHRKRDVIPFLVENAKNLRVDITPLENMMKRYLDEKRVRATGLELGVMSVRVPQIQPAPMRLRDMPEGSLNDWIIASASCFPIFPMRKINGERYIDGGYYDNLPIDMAIADGAEEIVAIDIHPLPTHMEYARMPFLKMIHPLHDLGSFLDFNPKLLRRNRMMGYYDAMKAYDYFDGIRYTFAHHGELKDAAAARRYMRRVAAFDSEAITRRAFKGSQQMNAPLISALESETPLRALSWKEVYLRGLELCARAMEFREDAIYDADQLTKRLIQFASNGDPVEKLEERAILEAAKQGSRTLIAYLFRGMMAAGGIPGDCVHTLTDYPDETAAALYLTCAATS